MQLGKRYGEQFQMSYITRDMDAAIAHCRSALGIETFHQTDTEAQVLSGGRMQTLVIRAAMANIGRQQFELIQPVSGPIHVYTDAVDLDAHIINFHHTAIAVRGDYENWLGLVNEVRASGDEMALLMDGTPADNPMVAFTYVDTRRRLGHYTEYLWWHETLDGQRGFPDLGA